MGIVAPNNQVADRFKTALGEHASTMLVSVDDVEGGDDEVIQSVMKSLEHFALDLIVVAPACAKLLESMDIPTSWKETANEKSLPEKDTVFIEAKPVNVLTMLSQSWVGARPGWLLSSSFVYM